MPGEDGQYAGVGGASQCHLVADRGGYRVTVRAEGDAGNRTRLRTDEAVHAFAMHQLVQQAVPGLFCVGHLERGEAQQRRQLRVAVALAVGLGDEGARGGQRALMPGPPALLQSHQAGNSGHHHQNCQGHDQRLQAVHCALSVRMAGTDETMLAWAELVVPLGEPLLSLGQWEFGEEGTIVLTTFLPLRQRAPQSLLPLAERTVGIDPLVEPLPPRDQGLVGQLHRLVPGRAASGHDQPGGRQPLGHRPPRFVELRPPRHPPGGYCGLVDTDQLGEHPPGRIPLIVGHALVVDPLRIPGQGAGGPAQGLIGGMGQLARLLLFPEESEGELEQRQISRLVTDVVEHSIDQPRLELGQPPCGLLDGAPELCAGHRAHRENRFAELLGQARVLEGGSEEVGPKCEDHPQTRSVRPMILAGP